MRKFQMLPVGQCLPGIGGSATRASWPVWSGSTTARVRFAPVSLKEARQLYRRAGDFEAQTRQAGRQDGTLGRNGMMILDALLFGFLNYRTGQLDPSYEAIASKARMSVRSVARGLQALYRAGVLHWQRRCSKQEDESGAFLLKQESNAYAVCPPSQWRGYQGKPEAPPPDAGTWGDHPPIERGTVSAGTFDAAYERMELDALASGGDALAAALARLGRALEGGKTKDLRECQRVGETRLT